MPNQSSITSNHISSQPLSEQPLNEHSLTKQKAVNKKNINQETVNSGTNNNLVTQHTTLPPDSTNNTKNALSPIVRTLIHADYQRTHEDMSATILASVEKKRQGELTPDEIWIVEHNDVYTLGQAGKEEHILQRGNTPIIKTDRGGQVTWHGKGQLVVYWLFDLNALGWSVRDLVSHAEQSIEDVLNNTLSGLPFYARARKDAPGVYIYSFMNEFADKQYNNSLANNNIDINSQDSKNLDNNNLDNNNLYNYNEVMLGKIASLGFKIKHGFSYHGIAINLDCDLSVFNSINPCGYSGMQMLKLADFSTLMSSELDHNISANDNNHGVIKQTDTITNLDFTEQLLENIIKRHAGVISLR